MDQEGQQNPQVHQRSPLSDLEIDERAAEAKAILANPVFVSALNDIHSRAYGTLLNADVGSLTATTAHATLKAIRDIRGQLEYYITDQKMRQRYGSGAQKPKQEEDRKR